MILLAYMGLTQAMKGYTPGALVGNKETLVMQAIHNIDLAPFTIRW